MTTIQCGWCSPNLLFNGYQRLFPQGCGGLSHRNPGETSIWHRSEGYVNLHLHSPTHVYVFVQLSISKTSPSTFNHGYG